MKMMVKEFQQIVKDLNDFMEWKGWDVDLHLSLARMGQKISDQIKPHLKVNDLYQSELNHISNELQTTKTEDAEKAKKLVASLAQVNKKLMDLSQKEIDFKFDPIKIQKSEYKKIIESEQNKDIVAPSIIVSIIDKFIIIE